MRALGLWADPRSPNMGVQVLAEGLRGVLPADWELSFASHASPLVSGPLSLRRLLLAILRPGSSMLEELRSYDLVIDVGEGDSFTSIYGWKRMAQLALSKIVVARSGTRLVLAPQTLGPWQTFASRLLARTSVMRADVVWARDSASERRGTDVLNRRVRLASDLVFGLPAPADRGGGRLDIVVNVSGLLWNPNPHVDFRFYRHMISDTLDRLHAAGKRVGLLAHVVALGSPDDDVAVVHELVEQHPGMSSNTSGDLAEARSFINRADLLVGARMHACLNALALGVPTIPMQYSDKFGALFEDLGYSPGIDLRTAGRGSGPRLFDLIVDAPSREATEAARLRGQALIGRFASSLGEHEAR